MLQEAISCISELAIKAKMPCVVKLPDEPPHVYGVANRDGSLQICKAEPSARNHIVFDISSLKDLTEPLDSSPTFWYSRAGIVLIFCSRTRRDRATLNLRVHSQMAKLMELERSKPSFDQKAFLSLLRIQFHGCDISDELVENLRHLRLRKKEEGEVSLQPSKASLGRSIQTELMGGKDFPERIDMLVASFEGIYGEKYRIACAVEIDPAKEIFQLIPFPGEIERAFLDAEIWLYNELSKDNPNPIFYGTP